MFSKQQVGIVFAIKVGFHMSRQHKTGFVQTSYAAELLFYAALNFAPCLKEQEQCLDLNKQFIFFFFCKYDPINT